MLRNAFYDTRRLVLSYAYEGAMRLLAWRVSVARRHRLILWFALACVAAGLVFTVRPDLVARIFAFEALGAVALTDLRAYYGTMLIGLGLALAGLAGSKAGANAALVVIIGFSAGSAAGRLIGFFGAAELLSIHGPLFMAEIAVSVWALRILRRPDRPVAVDLPVLAPRTPEDFRPLSPETFADPYGYYKVLRDDFPVYYLKDPGFYIISRYADITALAKNTTGTSSKLMEILATGKPKDPARTTPTPIERLGALGIIPVDVLAIQDPPIQTDERRIGAKAFSPKFVRSLRPEIETLADQMMADFLPKGGVEFIQDFAWVLPMRLIMRLLGLPEADYARIKAWCVHGIRALSGTATRAEMIGQGASSAQFTRYIWHHYRRLQRAGGDSFTAELAREARDPKSVMTDPRAVATVIQLLFAGSDSSASTMGNAVQILARNPEMQARLRRDPDSIAPFIEEVFRTEAAFQGHFRLTTEDISLHDVTIPAHSRLFLLWASGNRDDRFWTDPEVFDIDRHRVKKHLTFGHGIHACLGRELARLEIQIVIQKLLEKTTALAVVGAAPYEASLFARTLVRLPLAFTAKG